MNGEEVAMVHQFDEPEVVGLHLGWSHPGKSSPAQKEEQGGCHGRYLRSQDERKAAPFVETASWLLDSRWVQFCAKGDQQFD
jgi:hypothetical protein